MTPAEQRVAFGPVKGTDWCVLHWCVPDELVAPGGVVLTWEGTLAPHPDAAWAAASAWAILDRWHAANAADGHHHARRKP